MTFKQPGFSLHSGTSPAKAATDKKNNLKEAAKVTKAQLKGKKVTAVDDGSDTAKRDKADWEAKQARKAARAKKRADSKKVGDDALKYHATQARNQGVSMKEYKQKLKKRTRGY
jgi:hypothetical protein